MQRNIAASRATSTDLDNVDARAGVGLLALLQLLRAHRLQLALQRSVLLHRRRKLRLPPKSPRSIPGFAYQHISTMLLDTQRYVNTGQSVAAA
eukprot:1072619-Rhodomonas_salina.1